MIIFMLFLSGLSRRHSAGGWGEHRYCQGPSEASGQDLEGRAVVVLIPVHTHLRGVLCT